MRAHGSPPAAPRVCIECTFRPRAVRLPQGLEGHTLGLIAWRFSRCTRRLPSIVRALRGTFSKASADRGRRGKSNGGTRSGKTRLDTLRLYRNFWIERETGSTRQPGAANYTLLRRWGAAGHSSLRNFDASSLNTLWNYELGLSLIIVFNINLYIYLDHRFRDVFLSHASSTKERGRQKGKCSLYIIHRHALSHGDLDFPNFIFLTKHSWSYLKEKAFRKRKTDKSCGIILGAIMIKAFFTLNFVYDFSENFTFLTSNVCLYFFLQKISPFLFLPKSENFWYEHFLQIL